MDASAEMFPGQIHTKSSHAIALEYADEEHDQYIRTREERTILLDEFGRFKIWTHDFVADAPAFGRRSLEYCLRDSLQVRSTVSSLLTDLEDAVGMVAAGSFTASRPETVELGPIDEGDASDRDGVGILSSVDKRDDQSLTLSDYDDATPLQSALDEIHEIISCLNQFSSALLNPSRNIQPESSFMNPDDSYIREDQAYLYRTFPMASATLIERLARSNARHRQYLSFRRSSRRVCEELEETSDVDELLAQMSSVNLAAHGTIGPNDADSATRYAEEEVTLVIPAWPSDGQDGSPFKCPICHHTVSISTIESWREHVFEDLPPYLCTNDLCTIINNAFTSESEWAYHETIMHNSMWICRKGGQRSDLRKRGRKLSSLWKKKTIQKDDSTFRRLEALPITTRLQHGEGVAKDQEISSQSVSVARKRREKQVFQQLTGKKKKVKKYEPLEEPVEDESMLEEVKALKAMIKKQDDDRLAREQGNINEAAARKTKEKVDAQMAAKIDVATVDTREAAEQVTEAEAIAAKAKSDKSLAESEAAKAVLEKKQKELEEAMRGSSAPDMVKAPIKFKDAVGRKFSFPWHLCKTWRGMESLIKQAFLHVEILATHVQEGHYDLMGPDGEIILPQVWETMIRPDWEVSMHMWPMPETPRKDDKMKGRKGEEAPALGPEAAGSPFDMGLLQPEWFFQGGSIVKARKKSKKGGKKAKRMSTDNPDYVQVPPPPPVPPTSSPEPLRLPSGLRQEQSAEMLNFHNAGPEPNPAGIPRKAKHKKEFSEWAAWMAGVKPLKKRE